MIYRTDNCDGSNPALIRKNGFFRFWAMFENYASQNHYLHEQPQKNKNRNHKSHKFQE